MSVRSGPSVPTPNDLTTFLRLNGWHQTDLGRAASIWRRSETNQGRGPDEATVLVPLIPTASDYDTRVSLLLDDVAGFLGRGTETVRQQAALVHFDVAPLRAANNGMMDDSIPLHEAQELYTSARKLIVAAAGATIRRRGHFGRTMPRAAREHANNVRVGQTRRGSYVVPIISPAGFGQAVVATDHLDVDAEEMLFDRRVMVTMATALGALQEMTVTSDASPAPAAVTDSVRTGVSRELTQAIISSLATPAIASLDMAFNWAPASRPPQGAPSVVRFPDSALPLLRVVAEKLRVLDKPSEDVLYGVVTNLEHRPGDPQGRVGVEALVGRRIRTVWMDLDPDQYAVAKECHDRSKVVVHGRLWAPKGDKARMKVSYFGPDETLFDPSTLGRDHIPPEVDPHSALPPTIGP